MMVLEVAFYAAVILIGVAGTYASAQITLAAWNELVAGIKYASEQLEED